MRDKTCEERIDARMQGRLNEMRDYYRLRELADTWDLDIDQIREWGEFDADNFSEVEDEDDLAELERLVNDLYYGNFDTPESFDALSVDVKHVYTICMSYGGPADYWEVTTNSDGDVERIEYKFQDWFDGATRELHDDDLDIAESFLREAVYIGRWMASE